ncbi:hypothetical protein HY605_04055 [Candidatus Peregrinibacteria bacterium]|nr:hypothetical protein [Candidatus Peregrinibacteria bacterium]
MKNVKQFWKASPILFLCISLVGCMTIPKGFLKLPPGYLQKRQLQMRYYNTVDEEKILTAVTGVLQDLSFTLDDSESTLGLVVASKQSDAKDSGQIAGAVFLDVLAAALSNSYSANNFSRADKVQCIKASVIARPSLEEGRMFVRVTFQRIVWNMSNQISRVETISDSGIYVKFYDGLSKAVFLEANQI